jgi:predicted AAA+ superfamily ATPase
MKKDQEIFEGIADSLKKREKLEYSREAHMNQLKKEQMKIAKAREDHEREEKKKHVEVFEGFETLASPGWANSFFESIKSKVSVIEAMINGEVTLSKEVFYAQEIFEDIALNSILQEIEKFYQYFYNDAEESSSKKFIKVLQEQSGEDVYSLFEPLRVLQICNPTNKNEKSKITNGKLYTFCEQNKGRLFTLDELMKLKVGQGELDKLKNECSIASIIYKEIRCSSVHKGEHLAINIQGITFDKNKLLETYKNIAGRLINLPTATKQELFQRLLGIINNTPNLVSTNTPAKIHRSELDALLRWINKPDRKPLIIRGARQVGKSTLVRQLAEVTQRFCLELNFEKNPELSDFFSEKDPKKIMQLLATYAKRPLSESTLLFLDEVQAAPQVLENLRYFYEEYAQLPVIAAGSLLDFALEMPAFSVPVGRIEYFYVGPLSFEDFLTALGETHLVEWIRNWSIGDPVPLPLHQQCLDWAKQFWLIGGMPEVVSLYSQHRDFQQADNLKQNILQTYVEDFHKYGRAKQLPLLRRIFHTIPGLIGETLKYSKIDKESKSTQVRESLEHLQLARILHLICHSDATGLPLKATVNPQIFKTIFLDIGLLCAALRLDQLEIIKSPDWAWINRGSLAEQFVGQALLKLNDTYHIPELFYWVRRDNQAKAEIDYIWQYKNTLIPIEVKAGKTGTLKSLHYFIKEKNWPFAVRFNANVPSLMKETAKLSDGQLVSYKLLSLPFYMTEQLKRLANID